MCMWSIILLQELKSLSNPKKGVNLRISEDLLKEIDGIVQMCHDYDFPVNRSDLISTFLYSYVNSYNVSDVVDGEATTVKHLKEGCEQYYKEYDLSRRREDGVED